MNVVATMRRRSSLPVSLCFFFLACIASAQVTPAQERERGDEMVANLAGGRVIIHVARDKIVFAAIDQPVEPNSIPPRVLSIDHSHIGVLLGASEWRIPADPKPVRLDRDFPHVPGKNPHLCRRPRRSRRRIWTLSVSRFTPSSPAAPAGFPAPSQDRIQTR